MLQEYKYEAIEAVLNLIEHVWDTEVDRMYGASGLFRHDKYPSGMLSQAKLKTALTKLENAGFWSFTFEKLPHNTASGTVKQHLFRRHRLTVDGTWLKNRLQVYLI
jgi:uncharacterized protein YdaL